MRPSACDTRVRFCVRHMLCRSAFPLVPALGSTNSAADCSALFAGFTATMTGSDVPRSCIIGYGSSPSRCGPWGQRAQRSNAGPPRYRRDPSLRDGVFDHGGASVPRIAAPNMLPSTLLTVSASAGYCLSRLNSPPHRLRCVRFVALVAAGSRNTHCRAARYGPTRAGLPPADRASLPGAPRAHPTELAGPPLSRG